MKYFRFLIVSLFASALLTSSASAKTNCNGYRMTLDGQKTEMGVTYREHVVFEKVVKSGGMQGDWKLKEYIQEVIYPQALPIQIATAQRMDLTRGFWIDVTGVVQGNRILNQSTNSNVIVEVVGNRIGYRKTGIWCGSVQGGQATFKWDETNPLLPMLTGPVVLEGGQEIDLEILTPNNNERFVYTPDVPGELTITATAKAKPSTSSGSITWSIEDIDGSELKIQPANGESATFRFKGLPKDNGEFGPKKITAKFEVDGCTAEASRTVRVFYPGTAKNNPEKKYPNWFYYWKQTPAAKPAGQLITLEWGGRTVDSCTHCECPMIYKPLYKGGDSGHKMITVCDLATICTMGRGGSQTTPFVADHPLLKRNGTGAATTGKFEGWRTLKYIDLFASGIIHEYHHMLFDMTWRAGKSAAQIMAEDGDQDGIPNILEPEMGFDPEKQQTFYANDPVLKALQYDEEWLAYETQRAYQPGIYDAYDWAKPGKQWPE